MFWIKYEGAAYWTMFVVAFLAVAGWESFRPKRRLSCSAERRWGSHALLLAVCGVVMTALIRLTPVVVAAGVADKRFGILNKPLLPIGMRCLLGVLLLDFTQYAAHRAMHTSAWLWRVHQVHHSDADYDVSTAARFHPLEVLLVRGAQLAAIAVLAVPPAAAFASELLAVALNLFAHANASLPRRCEKLLRLVLITPDVHRIHHSEEASEQVRNFGQTFPYWDRLFGTYLPAEASGEAGIKTGIKELPDGGGLGLGILLAAPFQPRTESQTDPAA